MNFTFCYRRDGSGSYIPTYGISACIFVIQIYILTSYRAWHYRPTPVPSNWGWFLCIFLRNFYMKALQWHIFHTGLCNDDSLVIKLWFSSLIFFSFLFLPRGICSSPFAGLWFQLRIDARMLELQLRIFLSARLQCPGVYPSVQQSSSEEPIVQRFFSSLNH